MDVDYYMPGCPPEAHQIAAVLDVVIAALKGEGPLPPKGATVGVAPKTCCDECERVKEEKKIQRASSASGSSCPTRRSACSSRA